MSNSIDELKKQRSDLRLALVRAKVKRDRLEALYMPAASEYVRLRQEFCRLDREIADQTLLKVVPRGASAKSDSTSSDVLLSKLSKLSPALREKLLNQLEEL